MNRDIPDIDLTPPDYPEGETEPLKCSCCDEKIKDEFYYDIGKIFCTECLNENFRFETKKYNLF